MCFKFIRERKKKDTGTVRSEIMKSSLCIFCILCMLMINISVMQAARQYDQPYRHRKEDDSDESRNKITLRWDPLNDKEEMRYATRQDNSLKSLYMKVLHYVLHQFWELKIHIHRIEKELASLKQNKVETVSLTEPLKNATDTINKQFDELAQKMTQNVTLEDFVNPVEDSVVGTISECFKQINYSLLAHRPEMENHCNFSDLLVEVNSAYNKVKICHGKTYRYIARAKDRISNAGGQHQFHQTTIPLPPPPNRLAEGKSRDLPQYSTENYGYHVDELAS